MARIVERGLGRPVGVPGLFATAYGNVGSSIYYGLVALHALGLTPVVFVVLRPLGADGRRSRERVLVPMSHCAYDGRARIMRLVSAGPASPDSTPPSWREPGTRRPLRHCKRRDQRLGRRAGAFRVAGLARPASGGVTVFDPASAAATLDGTAEVVVRGRVRRDERMDLRPGIGPRGIPAEAQLSGGPMPDVPEQPDLMLAVEPDRDRVIGRLVGELDLAVAGRVEATVKELVDVGFADIVVDLRGLSFMDSAGVHMLVSTKRWAEQATARVSVIPGGGGRSPATSA